MHDIPKRTSCDPFSMVSTTPRKTRRDSRHSPGDTARSRKRDTRCADLKGPRIGVMIQETSRVFRVAKCPPAFPEAHNDGTTSNPDGRGGRSLPGVRGAGLPGPERQLRVSGRRVEVPAG